MFYRRGNVVPAVLICAAALYYLYRLFFQVAPPRRNAEVAPEQPKASDAEKAAIRAELGEMLVRYRRNRDMTRNVAIVLIAGASILMIVNPPLGIAIYMFAAIFAFLFYRNRKAVQLIEGNL